MMDKVQKHNSSNTNTPSSESYRNHKKRVFDHAPNSPDLAPCDFTRSQKRTVSFEVPHSELLQQPDDRIEMT
jgi:hypothetical protein